MRILSFVTHTPHAYDLANALHDSQFDLIGTWNEQQRPIPSNVRFMEMPDYGNYDLAIGHVGGETEAIIPTGFDKVPLILISHGAGEPFQSNNELKIDPKEIAKSCKDYKVVCCNEKEMNYWKEQGVKNATWIWHGMKDEFKQCQYRDKKAIIVNSGGWPYMNNVPLLEELHKRGIAWMQKDFQINSFEDYKNKLAEYNVYISGTRYSSFPRSRSEAMHAGLCVLTTHNWDEDKFFIPGKNPNMFLVENDADNIMQTYNSISLNLIEEVGKHGQQTAKDAFGLDKYRASWLKVIDEVLHE
jgi:glycosyltransferase involved in cell wall biosynthesis